MNIVNLAKQAALVFFIGAFTQCANNKKLEDSLEKKYNQNNSLLNDLIKVIHDKYSQIDTHIFYDCAPGNYTGNKYLCDSTINKFLQHLNAKSISISQETCDSGDFERTVLIDFGVRGYERIFYLKYFDCEQTQTTYENSRFKIIRMNKHWSIFEEKD